MRLMYLAGAATAISLVIASIEDLRGAGRGADLALAVAVLAGLITVATGLVRLTP